MYILSYRSLTNNYQLLQRLKYFSVDLDTKKLYGPEFVALLSLI